MPIQAFIKWLLLFSLCLVIRTVATADILFHARERLSSGQTTNLKITNPAAKPKPSGFNFFRLSWTDVQKYDSVELCFSSNWAFISDIETIVQPVSATHNCAQIIFLTTDGMATIKTAWRQPVNFSQPTISNTFTGSVMINGISTPDSTRLLSAYSSASVLQTINTSLPITVHRQKNDSGSYESGFYGGFDDDFDIKKPHPFWHQMGSDFLLTILPFSGSPQDSMAAEVEILLPSGDRLTEQLTKEEVNKLLASDSLITPSRLLRYLQRRHSQIRNWLSLRDNLEHSLIYNEARMSASGLNHIRNLLAELESLSISITPDEPENGRISVQGILGAPMGSEQGGKSTNSPSNRRVSRSPSLPSHQGKGTSREKNNDGRDQKDNSPPPPNPSSTLAINTLNSIELNIREVLERSGFNELFPSHAQCFLLGLYSYGQLSFAQLEELASNLHSTGTITGDQLIDLLEQRDNPGRAEALSIFLLLVQMQYIPSELSSNIARHTPRQWLQEIQREPLNTPDTALHRSDQLNRFLAQTLLEYYKKPRVFSTLSRNGLLSRTGAQSNYPGLFLIIETNAEDQKLYWSIIKTLEESTGFQPTLPAPFENLLNSPSIEWLTVQNSLENSGQAVLQHGQNLAEKEESTDFTVPNEPLSKEFVEEMESAENSDIDNMIQKLLNFGVSIDTIGQLVESGSLSDIHNMIQILMEVGVPTDTIRQLVESGSLNNAVIERLLVEGIGEKIEQLGRALEALSPLENNPEN